MKQLITILALAAVCCTLQAQELDFDTVVKAEEEVNSFEEYLVYLAWLNSPNAQQMQYRKEVAGLEIKQAKLGWLETFNPFVNYQFGNSEGFLTAGPNAETPNNIGRTNGLGLGISFRLLPLFTNKHKVAIAEENAKMVLSDVNNSKLYLRAQVLGRYYNYIYGQKAIEERLKTESDTKENYTLSLELFKKDLAQFEDVNNASSAYHKATEDRLRAELETQNAKILLEEYIGISLEEAMVLYGKEE